MLTTVSLTASLLPSVSTLDSVARVSAAHIVNTAAASVLLAVMAWCLLRLLPRENAGTRFAVWMATLVVIAALPMAGVISHGVSSPGSAASAVVSVPAEWALYLFLGTLLSPPATALATGVITLTMAGALVWGAKQLSR